MQRVGRDRSSKTGLPIARNLMDRGFQVIGYRRHGSPELVEALAGKLADSAAEVASQSDVLLSIVPDTAAVSVFASAKAVFDQALADGWGHLDIASVYDQISGLAALSQGEPS